jgi:hypothetical protein
MGLQIEIMERSSVIVVTLTGATDALQVAVNEGTVVVLDITELTRDSPLPGISDVFGPAVAALKLVARPTATSLQPHAWKTDIYPSVDAAIAAARDGHSASSNLTDEHLAAKFGGLRDQYGQIINECRQLLRIAEMPAGDSAQAGREP